MSIDTTNCTLPNRPKLQGIRCIRTHKHEFALFAVLGLMFTSILVELVSFTFIETHWKYVARIDFIHWSIPTSLLVVTVKILIGTVHRFIRFVITTTLIVQTFQLNRITIAYFAFKFWSVFCACYMNIICLRCGTL